MKRTRITREEEKKGNKQKRATKRRTKDK